MAKTKTSFDDSQLSPQERRQCPRLYFDFQQGSLREILGARILWPNESTTEVFDMSYSGAALRVPKKAALKAGEIHHLHIQLGDQPAVPVDAEIIWVREQMTGVRWTKVTPETRSAFGRFLVDKLVGASLTPIHPQFFSEAMTFDYWFHGPKDTNLYLWMERDERGQATQRVERAVVEIDDQTLVYEYGSLSCGKRSPEWDLQRDYGGVDELGADWASVSRGSPLVLRTMNLLSHVGEVKAPLQALVEELSSQGAER
ncbi:MAG: PilZ domain-containing protein [Bdellovibrionales bacterium]|nr:PilZ domain-containing protein [Bdellovibrionales bacterium]